MLIGCGGSGEVVVVHSAGGGGLAFTRRAKREMPTETTCMMPWLLGAGGAGVTRICTAPRAAEARGSRALGSADGTMDCCHGHAALTTRASNNAKAVETTGSASNSTRLDVVVIKWPQRVWVLTNRKERVTGVGNTRPYKTRGQE